MEKNNMKNMIVLKDLPSNLIEEAFIILKENQKIKNYEVIQNNKFSTKESQEKQKNYVVKEAEMVISNYISQIEKQGKKNSNQEKKWEKKYKQMRKLAIALGLFTSLTMAFQIFFIY